MGFMERVFGGNSRDAEDYVEIDFGDVVENGEAAMQVHIAEVADKEDIIDIKDAVYDGDVVVADITRHSTSDSTVEHIIDELRQVARETDGDIVQKGDDQLIVTPTGVKVSREKLNA
jgi:SepF-like predicted cell division protein (DUF552 family)